MTNKEAIEFLKNMIDREHVGYAVSIGKGEVAIYQYRVEALQKAIKAIEAMEQAERREMSDTNRMKRYYTTTPSAEDVQSCIDHIKTAVDVDDWAKIRCESLLQRMIPVKPTGKNTNRRCGVCGCGIRSGAGSSSFVYDTVCRNCFTVIDWG